MYETLSYSKEGGKGETAYYKCGQYRSAHCKARLVVKLVAGRLQMSCTGVAHSCTKVVVVVDSIYDAKREMEVMCEHLVETRLEMFPLAIAKEVMRLSEEKFSGLKIAFTCRTVDFMRKMVYRLRTKCFGEWESAVVSYPLMNVADDERLFLQSSTSLNIDNMLSKFLCWGHPDLLLLAANGPRSLYIDCTFRSVPHGFTQLLIVMLFDLQTDMYVPIAFVLMQGKKRDAYFHAVKMVIDATDGKLQAQTFTCDYELALIQACDNHFRGLGVLCDFHWSVSFLL